MTPEEKIQSLIDAADEVTGQSSSDLTSAVQSLINGYNAFISEAEIIEQTLSELIGGESE